MLSRSSTGVDPELTRQSMLPTRLITSSSMAGWFGINLSRSKQIPVLEGTLDKTCGWAMPVGGRFRLLVVVVLIFVMLPLDWDFGMHFGFVSREGFGIGLQMPD